MYLKDKPGGGQALTSLLNVTRLFTDWVPLFLTSLIEPSLKKIQWEQNYLSIKKSGILSLLIEKSEKSKDLQNKQKWE